jgi:hypothetical protein
MSDTLMDKLLDVVEANEFAALAFLALAVSRLPSAEREKTLQAI